MEKPMSLSACRPYLSWRGILRGLSVGLLGRHDKVTRLEQGHAVGLALLPLKGPALVPAMLVEAAIMLSPCHPEMGTKATEAGL